METKTKVSEIKKDTVRPEDPEIREKAYMEAWPENLQVALRNELEELPWRQLTISERLFLDPKGLPTIGVISPATQRLQEMILTKRVGQDVIDRMAQTKVQAVHNPTTKTITREIPPECGARLLISPPGGYWPISAFGSEFFDSGAAQASGLRLVDYDPENPAMNPPKTQTGKQSLDRRITDPEFAERISEAKKAEKLVRDRPEIIPALQAAMRDNPPI